MGIMNSVRKAMSGVLYALDPSDRVIPAFAADNCLPFATLQRHLFAMKQTVDLNLRFAPEVQKALGQLIEQFDDALDCDESHYTLSGERLTSEEQAKLVLARLNGEGLQGSEESVALQRVYLDRVTPVDFPTFRSS